MKSHKERYMLGQIVTPEAIAEKLNSPKRGDLMVYWHPQVPCDAFKVPVSSPLEAKKILFTLARYDAFQYLKEIKGDYANAGGLQVFLPEVACEEEDLDGWIEWYFPFFPERPDLLSIADEDIDNVPLETLEELAKDETISWVTEEE